MQVPSHGARPAHLVIMVIQWIRTSRLSINHSLSLQVPCRYSCGTTLALASRNSHEKECMRAPGFFCKASSAILAGGTCKVTGKINSPFLRTCSVCGTPRS